MVAGKPLPSLRYAILQSEALLNTLHGSTSSQALSTFGVGPSLLHKFRQIGLCEPNGHELLQSSLARLC
jgi:hypothetical protein